MAVLAVVAGTARAQSGDLELAGALARRRIAGLAEELYRRVLADPRSGPAERDAAELGLLGIAKARATGERDPERQSALYDEALRRYEEVLARPGAPPAPEGRLAYAELLLEKGAALAEAADRLGAVEEARAALASASGAWEKAGRLLQEAVVALRPRVEAAKAPATGAVDRARCPEATEDALVRAWLLEGEARVRAGASAPATEREALLGAALATVREFSWEFGERLVGQWGLLLEGRAHAELGKFADAEAAFRAVLGLPAESDFEELRLAAYARLAESYVQASRPADAVAAVARMEREYPRHLSTRSGQEARLARGEARSALEEHAEAVADALAVIEAPAPFLRGRATRRLALWSERDPSSGVRVRLLRGQMLKAEGAARPERLVEAIGVFQEAAAAIRTPEEARRYGVLLWKEVGDCYTGLERFDESGLAYTRGAAGRKDDLLAAECAFGAYRAFHEAARRGRDPEARERLREARRRLLADFPDAARARDLAFLEARDLEVEGRLLEAADAYERVPADSTRRESALERAGSCLARAAEKAGVASAGLLARAEARLREFLASTGVALPSDAGAERIAERAAARGRARRTLARISEGRAEWPDVLALVEGLPAEEAAAGRVETAGEAFRLEVRALAGLGRVAEAEGRLAEMAAAVPGARGLPAARLLVGKLLESEADRAEREGRGAEAAPMRRRSGWVYHEWLRDDAGSRDRDTLLAVAARLVALPDEARFLEAAAGHYEELRTRATALGLDDAGRDRVEEALTDALSRLGRLQDREGRAADAEAAWRRAIPVLDALRARHPKSVRILSRSVEAVRRVGRWDEALVLCASLLRLLDGRRFTPDWWQGKLWQCDLLLRVGEAAKAREILANLEQIRADLGGTDFAPQFRDLIRRAGR